LNTWAPWVVPYERPIYFIASRDTSREALEAAFRRLLRVELDDVEGYLEGGFEAWREAGYPTASLGQLDPDELRDRMHAGDVLVVDVRMADEYGAGHIPGARHVPVGRLQERLDELPASSERSIVTVCSSGYRSSLAGSLLLREGFEPVAHLRGGFSGWEKAGHEVEVPPDRRRETSVEEEVEIG